MTATTAADKPAAIAMALARRCIRALKRPAQEEPFNQEEHLHARVYVGGRLPVSIADAVVRALDRLGILARFHHAWPRCYLSVCVQVKLLASPLRETLEQLACRRVDLRRSKPSETLTFYIQRSFDSLFHCGWSFHHLRNYQASDLGFQEAIHEAEKLGRSRKNQLLVRALKDYAKCCRDRCDCYQARLVERRLARLS